MRVIKAIEWIRIFTGGGALGGYDIALIRVPDINPYPLRGLPLSRASLAGGEKVTDRCNEEG